MTITIHLQDSQAFHALVVLGALIDESEGVEATGVNSPVCQAVLSMLHDKMAEVLTTIPQNRLDVITRYAD